MADNEVSTETTDPEQTPSPETAVAESGTAEINRKPKHETFDRIGFPQELFGDEKYADFTIRCDGREFKVHKCVVCTKSPVFANMFKHDTIEKGKSLVIHEEFDSATIYRLLSHVYGITYEVSSTNCNRQMIEHIRVYLAADYYDICDLRKTVEKRFHKAYGPLTDNFQKVDFIDLLCEVWGRPNLRDTEFFTCVRWIAGDRFFEIMDDLPFRDELFQREGLEEFLKDWLKIVVPFYEDAYGRANLFEQDAEELQAEKAKILLRAEQDQVEIEELRGKVTALEDEIKTLKDGRSFLPEQHCTNPICFSYRSPMTPMKENDLWRLRCKDCLSQPSVQ